MGERDMIYEQELNRHVDRMIRVLDEFHETNMDWREKDILAMERAFQILIEAIIGLCRYVVRQCFDLNTSRSREAVDELRRLNIFSREEHYKLMKIIGFRNILVHDYLNVNEEILFSLVEKAEYRFIAEIRNKLFEILNIS